MNCVEAAIAAYRATRAVILAIYQNDVVGANGDFQLIAAALAARDAALAVADADLNEAIAACFANQAGGGEGEE